MTLADLSLFADKHPDGAVGLFVFALIVLLIVGCTISSVFESLAATIKGRR